jgi:hypothetical protein
MVLLSGALSDFSCESVAAIKARATLRTVALGGELLRFSLSNKGRISLMKFVTAVSSRCSNDLSASRSEAN